PGEGLWQRNTSPDMRRDAPVGVGSDLYSEDGRGGVQSAAATPGMMNEHEAREQLRSVDYSQPTVTSDTTRRTTSDDMRGTDMRMRTPMQSASYPTSSPTSEASPTASGASAANQQTVRSTGDGDLGAPIPDEFLEYEEDFRLHYD